MKLAVSTKLLLLSLLVSARVVAQEQQSGTCLNLIWKRDKAVFSADGRSLSMYTGRSAIIGPNTCKIVFPRKSLLIAATGFSKVRYALDTWDAKQAAATLALALPAPATRDSLLTLASTWAKQANAVMLESRAPQGSDSPEYGEEVVSLYLVARTDDGKLTFVKSMLVSRGKGNETLPTIIANPPQDGSTGMIPGGTCVNYLPGQTDAHKLLPVEMKEFEKVFDAKPKASTVKQMEHVSADFLSEAAKVSQRLADLAWKPAEIAAPYDFAHISRGAGWTLSPSQTGCVNT